MTWNIVSGLGPSETSSVHRTYLRPRVLSGKQSHTLLIQNFSSSQHSHPPLTSAALLPAPQWVPKREQEAAAFAEKCANRGAEKPLLQNSGRLLSAPTSGNFALNHGGEGGTGALWFWMPSHCIRGGFGCSRFAAQAMRQRRSQRQPLYVIRVLVSESGFFSLGSNRTLMAWTLTQYT